MAQANANTISRHTEYMIHQFFWSYFCWAQLDCQGYCWAVKPMGVQNIRLRGCIWCQNLGAITIFCFFGGAAALSSIPWLQQFLSMKNILHLTNYWYLRYISTTNKKIYYMLLQIKTTSSHEFNISSNPKKPKQNCTI